MKRTYIFLLAAGLLAATAIGCEPGTQIENRRSVLVTPEGGGEFFVVGVQQDGRKIPVRNHVVRLKRKPFDLVLLFSAQPGVLVNASASPSLLTLARGGSDLGSRAPLSNTFRQWRSATLLGSPDTWDYWYHYGLSANMTKFDKVRRVTMRDGKSAMACRKTIRSFQPAGADASTPIQDVEPDALHLVFVHAPAQSGGGRVENQRDWLTIVFE
ncbi:MAG: hypothetical protein ACLFV7_06240 [Phycisphaerae bacterium]